MDFVMQCLNRGLLIVGGITFNIFLLKRYYDTKRYHTNLYNIFDLKLLHLKTTLGLFLFYFRKKVFATEKYTVILFSFYFFIFGGLINGGGWKKVFPIQGGFNKWKWEAIFLKL